MSWDGEDYVLLQKISVSLERIADALEERNYIEKVLNPTPDAIKIDKYLKNVWERREVDAQG